MFVLSGLVGKKKLTLYGFRLSVLAFYLPLAHLALSPCLYLSVSLSLSFSRSLSLINNLNADYHL